MLEMYIWRIDEVVESISEFGVSYNKVTVSLKRISEIIDNKLYEDEKFGDKVLVNNKGVIEFKNVKFKYSEEEDYTLTGLNLKLLPNKKIAVVGKSGNGKSTIFNLLLRYFDTTKGEILIDGVNIKDLTEESLRNNISIIRQAPFLFNLSIIDNFKLVKKDVTLKEVREYCKRAYIDDYIMSLPKKYDTVIGEGGINLSGGQKQRLAIARTLMLNTKIILFDEATSALDPTTTRSILKLLKKLNEQLNLTIVIITHQMEVIKEICGKVAVMENGKIVEQGDVFSIFANPQNEVTKRFIRATSNLTKIDELIAENSPVVKLSAGEKLVRFSYIQKDVCEPLISATSRLYDITMNIIFAEIDFVQGSPIGGTVAIVSGKSEAIDRALEHIRDEGVGVEILKTA